jgi:hypothetical protein
MRLVSQSPIERRLRIPRFIDDPRDWSRPWLDNPGFLICCDCGGGGGTTLFAWGGDGSSNTTTESYTPNTWTTQTSMTSNAGGIARSNTCQYVGQAFANIASNGTIGLPQKNSGGAGGSWSTLTNGPNPMYQFSTTFAAVNGGGIHVVGGLNATTAMNSNQKYTVLAGTYSTMANLGYGVFGACQGQYVNSLGYVIEGNNGSGAINTNSAYDAIGDSWSTKSSSPVTTYEGLPTFTNTVGANLDICSAGWTASTPQPFHIYDSVGDSWSSGTSMPNNVTTDVANGAEAQSGGYIAGCQISGGGTANKLYQYASGTWTNQANSTNARDNCGIGSF